MHRFDVVAVGVAYEDTEISGVVFGPHARFVQHFRTERACCFLKLDHGLARRRRERNVTFAEAVARSERSDPEARELDAVSDHFPEVENSSGTNAREHGVVEPSAGVDVGALD